MEQESKHVELPSYEATVSEEGLARALEEVVDAKRYFANLVKVITTSRSETFPDGVDEFLAPGMTRIQQADGMLRAMDLLALLPSGVTWDAVATEIAERPQIAEQDSGA